MDWAVWVVAGAAVVGLFLLKWLGLVGAAAARERLRQGAKIIDVRTEAEYQQGHLPEAINIPLDRLREEISRQAPDKQQALLLHCLSGGRSSLGKRILRRMGYTNVFNLGSYGRARRIAESR